MFGMSLQDGLKKSKLMKNKNVTFRPIVEGDIFYRMKWLNDEDTRKDIIFDGMNDETSNKEWYLSCQKTGKTFFMILFDNNPIGLIGIMNVSKINKNAEIFIMIGEKEFRGKGIGKLALRYLVDVAKKNKINNLYLSVKKTNLKAINLYKQIGFKIVGKNSEVDMVLAII